jgi:hypothetical protein
MGSFERNAHILNQLVVKGVFFPAWPISARQSFRYRYVISRVSVALTVGERSEKKIRCDNDL